jgi:hypothetical protein
MRSAAKAVTTSFATVALPEFDAPPPSVRSLLVASGKQQQPSKTNGQANHAQHKHSYENAFQVHGGISSAQKASLQRNKERGRLLGMRQCWWRISVFQRCFAPASTLLISIALLLSGSRKESLVAQTRAV